MSSFYFVIYSFICSIYDLQLIHAQKGSIFLNIRYERWSLSNNKLPVANDRMAVASDDEWIYLLGGTENVDLVQINIHNNTIIHKPSYFASFPQIWGIGQYYSQSADYLFYIESENHRIMYWRPQQPNVSQQLVGLPPDTDVGEVGCLASTLETLYFIEASAVHLYIVDEYLWVTGPNTTISRIGASCILSSQIPNREQKLYVIGGTTVEYVSTFRMIFDRNQWQLMSDELTEYIQSPRSVIYNQTIFVVGGDSDRVHMIDMNTNIISLSPVRLNYSILGCALFVINDTIHALGGISPLDSLPTDLWQFHSMYVLKTSTNKSRIVHIYIRSDDPTAYPTTNPSFDPTEQPTTMTPTFAPSIQDVFSSIAPSISTTSNTQFTETAAPKQLLSSTELLLGVIVVLLVVVICLLVWMCLWIRQRTSKGNGKEMEQQIEGHKLVEEVPYDEEGPIKNQTSMTHYVTSSVSQSLHGHMNNPGMEMNTIKNKDESRRKSDSGSEDMYLAQSHKSTKKGTAGDLCDELNDKCQQCGVVANGKVDPNNNEFYCASCWAEYDV